MKFTVIQHSPRETDKKLMELCVKCDCLDNTFKMAYYILYHLNGHVYSEELLSEKLDKRIEVVRMCLKDLKIFGIVNLIED